MKYFAVVLVALIAAAYAADPIALNEEQKQRVRAAAGACLQQEQVPEAAVQKLRAGDFADVDQKTKCFVNCFLEKIEFLKNGVPNEEMVNAKLGPIVGADKIKAIQQQCNSQQGTDKCDTALKLYQCYFKQNASVL